MKLFNYISYPHMNIRVCLFCLTLVALTLSLGGCGVVTESVDDVIKEINNTKNAIAGESSGWRDELKQLADVTLPGMENKVSADVKGILADTTNQVADLRNETFKLADIEVTKMINEAGAEYRCNVQYTSDFVKQGVVNNLQNIIDDLQFWRRNKTHKLDKPIHNVCGITPDVLQLYPSGNGWKIDTTGMSDPTIVRVFGYNLWSDILPTLELQDAQGNPLPSLSLKPAYVTRYQFNLNFSDETFSGVQSGASAQIVFRWPDQPDPNAILLTPQSRGILTASNPRFEPPSPTALKDLVILRVTIENTGGSPVQDCAIYWNPDPLYPNDVQSKKCQEALRPKEPRDFDLGPYQFKRGGDTIKGMVSFNTPDPSLPVSLYVASPPPPPPLTEESSLIDTSSQFRFACDMRADFDANIDAPQGYTWDGDTNNIQITPSGSRTGDVKTRAVVGTPTMQGQTLQLKVHIGVGAGAFPGSCGTLYIQVSAVFVGQLH